MTASTYIGAESVVTTAGGSDATAPVLSRRAVGRRPQLLPEPLGKHTTLINRIHRLVFSDGLPTPDSEYRNWINGVTGPARRWTRFRGAHRQVPQIAREIQMREQP